MKLIFFSFFLLANRLFLVDIGPLQKAAFSLINVSIRIFLLF